MSERPWSPLTDESSTVQGVDRRWWYLGLGLLLLLAHGFLLPRQGMPGLDGQSYLGAAEGLATGAGYRGVHCVGAPPQSTYPPLHSALLSLGYRWGGEYPGNELWLRGILLGVSWTGLMLMFRSLMVREVPPWFAALLTLLVGTGATWMMLVGNFMAEPLFLVLIGVLAWWTEPGRWLTWKDTGAWRWWLGLGVIAGAMYLARSAAAGIVAGMGLAALLGGWWRRPVPGLAFGAAFLGLASFWILAPKNPVGGYAAYFNFRMTELGGPGGYFREVARQVWDNASGESCLSLLSDIASRVPDSKWATHRGLGVPLRWAAQAVGIVGVLVVVRGFRRQRQPWDAAVACVMGVYLLQIVLWPWRMGPRGAVFLLPWLGVWLWRGSSLERGGWRRVAATGIAGVVLLGNVYFARGSRQDATLLSRDFLTPVGAWVRTLPASEVVGLGGNHYPYDLARAVGRPLYPLVKDPEAAFQAALVPAIDVPRCWILRGDPPSGEFPGAPVVFQSPGIHVVEVPLEQRPRPGRALQTETSR